MKTRSPLRALQQDLLDGNVPLTRLLQSVIRFAGESGSTQLCDWARRELDGYVGEVELPSYRTVAAQLNIDGENGHALIKGQSIGPDDLPDFVQEAGIGNQVPLPQGLAELEDLANGSHGPFVHIALPGGDLIAKAMNHEIAAAGSFSYVHRVYWTVSKTAIRGVVESIRTAVLVLVSELVRTLPPDQEVPTKEQADQAVHFTVTGKRNQITFTNSQASGGGISAPPAAPVADSDTWWKRWRKRGIVVGLISMAGATAGVLNYLQIAPWS